MIKRLIAIVVALFAMVGPTSAQVGFGVKVGAKINDLRFEEVYYEDTYNQRSQHQYAWYQRA